MQHDVKDTNVMADINVTPMVDVMLVLLIIFMVVTPALLTGFQATLPQAVNLKERPEDEEATTLGIDRDGNYYLNKKPIDKANAKQLLTAEFLRHPDDKILFVKTDQKLKYGEVITAMDLARDAGARVLAVVTEAYAKDDDKKGHE